MKRIVACAVVGLAALAVRADVMNWQVAPAVDGYTYNAARLVAKKDGAADIVINDEYGDSYQVAVNGIVGSTTTDAISTLTGYTFFIELGSYSAGVWNNTVAQAYVGADASSSTYEQLRNAGIIGNAYSPGGGGLSGKLVSPSAASFSQVPEPGTATLILLGMAIAGLKRRRV